MKNEKIVTRNPLKAEIISISKDQTTVKVSISRIVPDKLYGKRMYLNTYLLADATSFPNLQVGNFVKVLPCRKISKRKSWKVVASVEKHL